MRQSRKQSAGTRIAVFTTIVLINAQCGFADDFTYVDEDGRTVQAEARLVSEGFGHFVLERADGQRLLVPQAAVKKRVPKAGPTPLSANAIAQQLKAKFGAENFRYEISAPYVVGLVLAEPLPKRSESRVSTLLKRSAKYMHEIQQVFTQFAKDANIPVHDPKHPLVVLIFETDAGFDTSFGANTKSKDKDEDDPPGLSALVTLGFYSPLTNYLHIRMSECYDFETPLHEAIHQHCYNRGVLQRLAPIPTWFAEGIATGFEGNGETVDVGPAQINPRYAIKELTNSRLSWEDAFKYDQVFRGDVLAGDAYSKGWAMHWYLFSQKNRSYSYYLKYLSKLKPLQPYTQEDREADFQAAFSTSLATLEDRCNRLLPGEIRRQRIKFDDELPPGYMVENMNLARVTLFGQIRNGGRIYVRGTIRNLSLIRPMTFRVMITTPSGLYTEWIVPDLNIKQRTRIKEQFVNKWMRGAPGGPSETFSVRVEAVTTNSDNAIAWKAGRVPVPVFKRE